MAGIGGYHSGGGLGDRNLKNIDQVLKKGFQHKNSLFPETFFPPEGLNLQHVKNLQTSNAQCSKFLLGFEFEILVL
jgi:hypothetical protein